MRVLMLASEYPPAKIFGLGRAVHDLSRALAEGDDEVHVLTNSIGGRDQDTAMAGVNVHRINYPNPPQPPDSTSCVVQFNICLVERAHQILPDLGAFDLVHAHDWLVALAADAIRTQHRIPLVTTIHDTALGKYFGELDRSQQYIAFTERWLVSESSRVIACSEFIRRELVQDYGAEPARTDVVPCGVNPSLFSAEVNLPAFRSVFAREGERVILYVGRLDPEKGVEVLLRAFADLLGRRSSLRLVVAGQGQRRQALADLVEELSLEEHVTFLGYVAHPALAALYQSAAVVTVPSLYEPFGLVALEAMVCCRPLASSDAGGLAEIVEDGKTGLRVPAGDVGALAQALESLLDGSDFAGRLAEAGRNYVIANYSWDRVAEQTRRTYQRALSAPKMPHQNLLPRRPERPAAPSAENVGSSDGRSKADSGEGR